MLKGIPNLLTPELLKILMEMGHGDSIVIGDGNFPHASIAKNSQLVRLDGHNACEVLDAILTLMPLDTYVDAPVTLMEVVPGDNVETPIWGEFAAIIDKHQPGTKIQNIERFKFYDEAKKCYAVVSTSESALYANVILQKGVIK
jgi:L-fucose mutarotase